ncbi:MAG: histidinol-phosphate aminotransferase family protein [Oscillospiraceae bacterium]|nr:histidinol-phosphate aminotransferase family protein [Oscillospiraceae bacterium]
MANLNIIPKKLEKLVPYEPLEGNYKIRLDANESYLSLEADELARAVSGVAVNRYPDPYARGVLRAFGDLYGVNPDNVTAGNGSDELISIINSCLLNKGDKILSFAPDFSMYFFYPPLYELDLTIQQKEKDLTINFSKAVEKINTENIKAVILSNPCNPTSLGIKSADIKRLIDETSALVILDEAYMDFWDEAESLLKAAPKTKNLIVLKTCSKALALAGIRLGFAVADVGLTKALRAAKSPYNVNLLTQAVGEYALSNKTRIKDMAARISEQTRQLKAAVLALNIKEFVKIYDTAANFIFIETPDTHTAKTIYDNLLASDIAVRALGKFLRITCGSEQENRILLKELKSLKEKQE